MGIPIFFSNLQLVHLSTPVLSVRVGWVSAEGEVSTVSPDRVAQLYQGDPLDGGVDGAWQWSRK